MTTRLPYVKKSFRWSGISFWFNPQLLPCCQSPLFNHNVRYVVPRSKHFHCQILPRTILILFSKLFINLTFNLAESTCILVSQLMLHNPHNLSSLFNYPNDIQTTLNYRSRNMPRKGVTSALDGWAMNATLRPLYRRKELRILFQRRLDRS